MSDVRRFSDIEVARLFEFYSKAEMEILERINRGLLRGNDLTYLQTMLQNVRAILNDILDGSRTWCEEAIPRVYTEGLKNADAMLNDAGVTLKAGFGAIHQQAAQVLAENAYQRFEDVVQVIGRQVNDIYRDLALENVRGTVVGYDTWKQTARRYREQLAERGVTGFKDRTGRMWNMRTYTEMVARTTTMQAHLEGTANRLVEQGHDLVKISTHRGACELCQPWQGKILSITGKTEGYPTLEEAKAAGLFHPNCYSKDTEVYTDKGWRLFSELSGDEKILSLNPETHCLEWVNYRSIISYRYSGNMLRFKSNSLDLLVTPDHNMYVGMNSHYKGKKILKYKLMPAGQLRERNFKIPRTAKWEGESSKKEFMGIPIEQFAKLLGYFLSEGHAEYDRKNRRYRVSICQHDKRNMEIMYNDLKSIGFYECHNRLILSGKELASYFLQLGKAHEKHIPDWFMEQPPEILRLFLDAYALGDGSTRTIARPNKKLNSVERKYFTSSKRLAEQIGECILKVGKYPYFYLQRVSGKQCSFRNGDYIINHDVWVIAENTSPHSVHNASPSCKHRGIHITEEGYNDMVYCVELEKNHVLWVRRNGRTAWCGNCRHAYGLYIDLDKEIEELEIELEAGETTETELYNDSLLKESKDSVFEKMSKEYSAEYKEKLTDDEIEAIRKYQGLWYLDINNFLRGRAESISRNAKTYMKNLQKAIEKLKIKENILVARGTTVSAIGGDWDAVRINNVITDEGFMSTSLREETALGFVNRKGERGILMYVKVPKGTNGVILDVAVNDEWESELLLKPGTKIRITGKRIENGMRIIEGEVVNE